MGLTKDCCTWTHAGGAGVNAHPPPRKTKTFFSQYGGPFCYYFSIGRALCYVFLLMRDFFHCMEAFLLLFLYVVGFFATSSSWCGAFFTMLGPFLLIFSLCGGTFLSSWGILCLYGFFWACPFPP